MNIFRKKNKIVEPQEPESTPDVPCEPVEGCEPCPGEPIAINYCSHAEGFSTQCFGNRAYATGYYSREEENK